MPELRSYMLRPQARKCNFGSKISHLFSFSTNPHNGTSLKLCKFAAMIRALAEVVVAGPWCAAVLMAMGGFEVPWLLLLKMCEAFMCFILPYQAPQGSSSRPGEMGE